MAETRATGVVKLLEVTPPTQIETTSVVKIIEVNDPPVARGTKANPGLNINIGVGMGMGDD